jgi:hypothetical protein
MVKMVILTKTNLKIPGFYGQSWTSSPPPPPDLANFYNSEHISLNSTAFWTIIFYSNHSFISKNSDLDSHHALIQNWLHFLGCFASGKKKNFFLNYLDHRKQEKWKNSIISLASATDI